MLLIREIPVPTGVNNACLCLLLQATYTCFFASIYRTTRYVPTIVGEKGRNHVEKLYRNYEKWMGIKVQETTTFLQQKRNTRRKVKQILASFMTMDCRGT